MLKFTGDVCFTDNHFDIGYGVGSYIAKGGNPFAFIAKNPQDVWVGNFECVASTFSPHTDYHKDCFRIDPALLQGCQLFDYFGIANNHVMEHGPDAYNQMRSNLLTICKGTFGSLENKSVIFDHQDKKVAVTGFCLRREENPYNPAYWCQPDLCEIEAEYKTLNAHYKVAYIHWGVEFVNYPTVEQVKFAQWLIDLGYDLIIGMHPHVMQGYEVYKGKHIFYSLGNFVFNMAYLPTKYAAVVNVDVANGQVAYEYVLIDKNYCPHIIEPNRVPDEFRFDKLNKSVTCVQNPEEYAQEATKGLKKYRKSHHCDFIRNIGRYDISVLKNILLNFLKRRIKNGN